MRLKHIKLAGFKSFVDATTVPFPDQMTAIVGPNGCGKSNVIDAVRWVLGESSAKNLRGDAMTDVIFNGSTNRKPVSQASVELVFDNSESRLEGSLADRVEISVKRLVTKDGQSSYFLNGSKCRRRDITDIFLGTGLGPRSYAIIEQGMISRLIESKPQELRIFIEEAAGISKYKERRRETETRIRHTRDNLERLEDVCQELGSQLEKLKRQAATARRYKELKGQERTLKAELYALKWLKYNEQLNLYEKDRLAKEVELEAFISQQRGGELGLVKLKETYTHLSDRVHDAQQGGFQIANQITRIEQQIVFAKDTRQRLQEESLQIARTIEDAELHLAQEREKLEEIQETLEISLPEQELLQEEFEVASEQYLLAQEEYDNWQEGWERLQRSAAESRQAGQVIYTKLQGLDAQLERMQQRVTDLHREVADLDDARLNQELEPLSDDMAQLTRVCELHESKLAVLDEELGLARDDLAQKNDQYQAVKSDLLQVQAKLQGLHFVQQDYESSVDSNLQALRAETGIESHGSLLSQLNVEESWQTAVESLLAYFGDALLVKQLPDFPGHFVMKSQENARAGSLATVVKAGAYPDWFNHVAVVERAEEVNRLDTFAWIGAMDASGRWQGNNWCLNPGANKSTESQVLKRIQQIQQLEHEVEEKCEVSAAKDAERQLAAETLSRIETERKELVFELESQQKALQETKIRFQLLQQQKQQNQTLINKLNVEAESLVEQIEMEAEQKLALQDELELNAEQQIIFDEQLGQLESDKQRLAERVSQMRAHVDEKKNRQHQMAIKLQALTSQESAVQQNVERGEAHLAQMQQKLQLLQQSPDSDKEQIQSLQIELEELLEARLEAEAQLLALNTELARVAEEIAELEQGQSGVLAKVDKMKGDIAAIKLDSEGARVRAQNMLEVLNDMSQPIKPILEAMPSEAEENEWAERLEKTSNSIARLGAINLTAIEEYELQAERKGYLDAQYQDLVSALETLEGAIKKIDRESRAKFKQTYEQVNSDLQHLFPKVFGGGAAYLELTGEDLLDTGVTIMARPPGKKNSTIHLLSGGEKALTALSLVFSIFRLNPAPFCMLDEVDAPLDDANVGRFCNLVKEMSETVQFIYISHNKVAMEMATHLTGVTMQEPGVSRLVAVDIQEAVQMAEAS